MDPLTDILHTLEVKGWLASRTEIAPPWRFHFAASQDSVFHIFHFGGGYLRLDEEPTPRRIEDGDVILLPYGHAHVICDQIASPLTKATRLDYDPKSNSMVFPFEGEGKKTVLLCGAFRIDHPDHYPLLRYLPKIIHIPGEQGSLLPGFAHIMRSIAEETSSRQPGAEVLLRRFTELLFIQTVRFWLNQHATITQGWLLALDDPAMSTALGLMHQSPERAWTVDELADAVALSRSTFFARFTHLVGEPPLKYLTRWRMHMATQLLKKHVKMDVIAQHIGYDSEVAFRKAFKREVGMSPGHYRKLDGSEAF